MNNIQNLAETLYEAKQQQRIELGEVTPLPDTDPPGIAFATEPYSTLSPEERQDWERKAREVLAII